MHRSRWLVQAEPGRRVRPPASRPRSPRRLDRPGLRRLRTARLVEEAREPIRSFDGRRGLCPRAFAAGGGDAPVLHVIGESLLLLPPLVFIHVFLAIRADGSSSV
jgi:hypothetical protein